MERVVEAGAAEIVSAVTLEVLRDDQDHRRRGNNDTELLDRAEFLLQVIERSYWTIITATRFVLGVSRASSRGSADSRKVTRNVGLTLATFGHAGQALRGVLHRMKPAVGRASYAREGRLPAWRPVTRPRRAGLTRLPPVVRDPAARCARRRARGGVT
jgi:hypothetical protein